MNRDIQVLRACDRCHAIKERCRRASGCTRCERCIRLDFDCGINRKAGRPGRRPRRYETQTRDQPPPRELATRESPQSPQSISWGLFDDIIEIPNDQLQKVQSIFLNNDLLEVFLVGPTFCDGMRQQLIPQLAISGANVREAVLAFATSWADPANASPNPRQVNDSFHYASSALRTLSNLQVSDFGTMADCLTIGAFVLTFALKWRVKDVLSISRQTLLLLKPLYNSGKSDDYQYLDFLTCLVMWDIYGSIFQSSEPTLRYRVQSDEHVDRYIGLCVSFIPLLQDICDISHSCQQEYDPDNFLLALASLEEKVLAWRPTMPDDLANQYRSFEISHMLCQAQVLQLAARLILHRLRHPYGTENGTGRALSTTILMQLDMTHMVTKRSVKCADLAILVAYFEIEPDERDKWIGRMEDLLGYSSQYRQDMQQTVQTVWEALDSCETFPWSSLATLRHVFWKHEYLSDDEE